MSLEDIIKKVNKKFKKEVAVRGIKDVKIERIPFSSPRLNWQTYGGIPRNRLIEFAGAEGSGKTTTALDIIYNAQKVFEKEWEDEIIQLRIDLDSKLNKTDKTTKTQRLNLLEARGPRQIAYFDIEGTLEVEWAAKFKVDVDNLVLFRLQEQTAEEILDIVLEVIRDGDVGLIVIDSIAVLVPQMVFDESLEQKSYGGNSAVITQFVNRAVPLCGSKECTCILINQVREDLANQYVQYKTPGGKALKHQSSLRIMFKADAPVNELGVEQKKSYANPQGNIILTHILKTKVCKPDRRISYYTINYDNGVDIGADLFEIGLYLGFIQGVGWYTFVNKSTGEYYTDSEGNLLKIQGKENVLEYFRDNPEFRDLLLNAVNEEIKSGFVPTNEDIDEFDNEEENFEDEHPEIFETAGETSSEILTWEDPA